MFYKNEQGSFTLEASLVFPFIFFITLLFLYLSLMLYQKVILYYSSSIVVERLAMNWSNSYKLTNGEFQMDERDPIDWREKEDPKMIEKKIGKASALLPKYLQCQINYTGQWQDNIITITLDKPLKGPRFLRQWVGTNTSVTVKSQFTDPAEMIRLVQRGR